jgi:ribonucleoside-diphosphate reductase alpha chain
MEIEHGDLARKRLPNRRASETFEITAGGLNYRATVSRFDDGRVAEIFLTNHKVGSHADTAARDSAVVCSIALQFGVPLETIRHALMRDGQGRPNGPLGIALDLLTEERAP